jgi:EamA domain-containing membrane protein RarD
MQPTNAIKAISLKVASALIFAVMASLVRYLGTAYPIGQVVFFRSAFAIVPVVVIYAWRRELEAAIRMGRPFGHAGRGITAIGGMFCNFSALARLPIVDATAISFAAPLITVALAALLLKERVRIYRCWRRISTSAFSARAIPRRLRRPKRWARFSGWRERSSMPDRSSRRVTSPRARPRPRSCSTSR